MMIRFFITFPFYHWIVYFLPFHNSLNNTVTTAVIVWLQSDIRREMFMFLECFKEIKVLERREMSYKKLMLRPQEHW